MNYLVVSTELKIICHIFLSNAFLQFLVNGLFNAAIMLFMSLKQHQQQQQLSSGIFWMLNGFVAKERNPKQKSDNLNVDNESRCVLSQPQPH